MHRFSIAAATAFGLALLTTAGSWRQEARLADSPGAANQTFGPVLAASEDGSTIVAGHSLGNSPEVFVRPAEGWSGNVAPAAALGGSFSGLGWSVAISDDGKVIAAGAPFVNTSNGFDAGAIIVYLMPPGGWSGSVAATAVLTASDPGTDINLGLAVAMAGDTIFGGFPAHRVGGHSDQGAVYVFVRPDAGWTDATQNAELTDSRGLFLSHVLAASADGSAVVASSSGAAFVFERPAGGWRNISTGARLVAEHGAASGFASVAVSGDTVFEGSATETIGGKPGQGSVYVFARPSGGWAGDVDSIAELTASDGAANDALGSAISISGDRVFAGAPAAKVAGHVGQGAAYVFDMPEAGWVDSTETARIVASDGAAGDQFGTALGAALEGSMVAVGAPNAMVNGHAKQGAIDIFELPAPPLGVIPIAAGSLSRVGSRR